MKKLSLTAAVLLLFAGGALSSCGSNNSAANTSGEYYSVAAEDNEQAALDKYFSRSGGWISSISSDGITISSIYHDDEELLAVQGIYVADEEDDISPLIYVEGEEDEDAEEENLDEGVYIEDTDNNGDDPVNPYADDTEYTYMINADTKFYRLQDGIETEISIDNVSEGEFVTLEHDGNIATAVTVEG